MHETASAVVVVAMALSACGPGTPRSQMGADVPDVSDAIRQLEPVRVFFAHQSVGANIMDGVTALMKEEPGPSLDVIRLASTAGVAGGFLAHESLGVNGDPNGKTDAFVSTLEGGLGKDLDIALQKYCFIDFDPTTDAHQVFSYYQQGIERIHREFPHLTIVHVTAPLMTVQTGPKALVKKLLGRAPGQFEDNVVRERFNELVRQAYDGREPVFDLARLESSKPGDPNRISSSFKGETAFGLLPEYTTDGGHLTGPAEKLIAAELLRFLASVAVRRDPARDASERP